MRLAARLTYDWAKLVHSADLKRNFAECNMYEIVLSYF